MWEPVCFDREREREREKEGGFDESSQAVLRVSRSSKAPRILVEWWIQNEKRDGGRTRERRREETRIYSPFHKTTAYYRGGLIHSRFAYWQLYTYIYVNRNFKHNSRLHCRSHSQHNQFPKLCTQCQPDKAVCGHPFTNQSYFYEWNHFISILNLITARTELSLLWKIQQTYIKITIQYQNTIVNI